MREVDPFDYWESHSSAIEGLGGRKRSPDPGYCFHTRYHEVRPGHASFIVKLTGVSARTGELSVRIHAWKPETDSNVSLVSGSRLMFHDGDEGDLSLSVSFVALKGVLYAFYGYLSEDFDLTAQKLHVEIDEPEGEEDIFPDPPRSILVLEQQAGETRPANALLHFGRTGIDAPVSQNCTYDQLSVMAPRGGPDATDAALAWWSDQLCLNALHAYGITHPGLNGLVVGSVSAEHVGHLQALGLIVRTADGPPPPRTSGDFFDFLSMPAVLGHEADARSRWETVEGWLARLKIGGVAVFGLRYRAEGDLVSSSDTIGKMLSRNEIGQWALRLIGSGYSVAPLAFAPVASLVVDSQGHVGFIMIVQRL